MLSSVDLPEPEGPEQHDEFALVDVEIDVPEGVDLDFAHPIGLGQIAGLKHHATRFALLPGLVQRHDVLLLPARPNERRPWITRRAVRRLRQVNLAPGGSRVTAPAAP